MFLQINQISIILKILSIIVFLLARKVSTIKYCSMTGKDEIPGCQNYDKHLGCQSDVK